MFFFFNRFYSFSYCLGTNLKTISHALVILINSCWILGNFSTICCCLLTFFFKINFFKKFFQDTIRVTNGLDPDQDRHFVGPELGPNCLQRLSADDKSPLAQWVNVHVQLSSTSSPGFGPSLLTAIYFILCVCKQQSSQKTYTPNTWVVT